MLASMANASGGLGEAALPYYIVSQVWGFYSFLMNCLCSLWDIKQTFSFKEKYFIKSALAMGKHIFETKRVKDNDFHKCLIY